MSHHEACDEMLEGEESDLYNANLPMDSNNNYNHYHKNERRSPRGHHY
jgi:hypothetical protein